LEASFIVRELFIELLHRVSKLFRDALSTVHVNTVPCG
jgi:hypothetical protein